MRTRSHDVNMHSRIIPPALRSRPHGTAPAQVSPSLGQELPSLERLYLSANRLEEDPNAVAGVLACHTLLDLALDENNLCKV